MQVFTNRDMKSHSIILPQSKCKFLHDHEKKFSIVQTNTRFFFIYRVTLVFFKRRQISQDLHFFAFEKRQQCCKLNIKILILCMLGNFRAFDVVS